MDNLSEISSLSKQGRDFFNQGNHDAASEAFASALKIDPNHKDTLFNCAHIAESLNCRHEARAMYLLYLGCYPDDENALKHMMQLHDPRLVGAEPKEKSGALKTMLETLAAPNPARGENLIRLWQAHRATPSPKIYWIASSIMKYYLPSADLPEQQKWLQQFSPLLLGIGNELKNKNTDQLPLHSQYLMDGYRYCIANVYFQKYLQRKNDRMPPDDAHAALVSMGSWKLGCLDQYDRDLLEKIVEAFNSFKPGIYTSYDQYTACFALMLFREPSRLAANMDSDTVFLSYVNGLKKNNPQAEGNVYCSRFLAQSRLPEEYALWYLENYADISKYRDKHRGESCFIIGNGPSLRQMDLSPLRHRFTFGLNKIYLLFDKLGFQTSYLVAANAYVLKQAAREYASLSMPQFLMMWGREFVRKKENILFLREDCQSHFMKDMSKGVCVDCTVTYMAMQIAYFMGFSTAVLIGVDHHFESKGDPHSTVKLEGGDPNHFDPNYFGYGVPWQLPDLEGSERAYRSAKAAFEGDGRRLLDATVGGKLQIYPKISYEEALAITAPADQASLDRQAAELNRQGSQCFEKGDTDGAMRAFTKALEISPNFVGAHNNLGILYWKAGNPQKSQEHFARALEIAPNDRNTVINCGEILKFYKRSEEAKAIYSSYLQRNPGDEAVRKAMSEMEALPSS